MGKKGCLPRAGEASISGDSAAVGLLASSLPCSGFLTCCMDLIAASTSYHVHGNQLSENIKDSRCQAWLSAIKVFAVISILCELCGCLTGSTCLYEDIVEGPLRIRQ